MESSSRSANQLFPGENQTRFITEFKAALDAWRLQRDDASNPAAKEAAWKDKFALDFMKERLVDLARLSTPSFVEKIVTEAMIRINETVHTDLINTFTQKEI